MKSFPGFTLIEIMVVIGILSIVTFFAVPFTMSQLGNSRSYNAAAEVSSNIFFTQQQANSTVETIYCVFIEQDKYSIVTFQYDEENEENACADEGLDGYAGYTKTEYTYSQTAVVTDIIGSPLQFERGSFRPLDILNFTVSSSGSEAVVEINSQGLINYYID